MVNATTQLVPARAPHHNTEKTVLSAWFPVLFRRNVTQQGEWELLLPERHTVTVWEKTSLHGWFPVLFWRNVTQQGDWKLLLPEHHTITVWEKTGLHGWFSVLFQRNVTQRGGDILALMPIASCNRHEGECSLVLFFVKALLLFALKSFATRDALFEAIHSRTYLSCNNWS